MSEMLDAFARLEEMRQKYLANTLPAPADDDEPSAGDHPLFVGGAP